MHRISGPASKDLDEVLTGEVTSRFLGVLEESLSRVVNAESRLADGASAINATGRLCGVSYVYLGKKRGLLRCLWYAIHLP